jgi:hypothetical protein
MSALINGRQYEWADATIIVAGKDLMTIRAFKINRKAEREAVYGKGRNPISIQSGNNMYEGSFGILQSDLILLEESLGGDLLSGNFDILIGLGNPSAGDALIKKRAVGVRVTEIDESLKQGDKFMEIEIPFLCLNWKNV